MSTPVDRWRQRDNFSTPRHQELVDRVNQFSLVSGSGGVDVISTRHGTGVSVEDRRSSSTQILVRVDRAASDGECYWGKILEKPTAIKRDGTGNLTAADIGTIDEDSDDVLILNVAGRGRTTHSLTTGVIGNLDWPAEFLDTNEDGVDVYLIWGFSTILCDIPLPP